MFFLGYITGVVAISLVHALELPWGAAVILSAVLVVGVLAACHYLSPLFNGINGK